LTQDIQDDIQNYTTIIITRNPYERIVSGFLNKYKPNSHFLRTLWKHPQITFKTFVDETVKNNWQMVDKHHFTPQTTECFNKDIINKSKAVKLYDIKNIDYKYIESLYDVEIPPNIISFKGNHILPLYQVDYTGNVYNFDMKDYMHANVEKRFFYNDEIKNKVYSFFLNDFTFCNEHNIKYDIDCSTTNEN
jgi:hypothetical protein